MEHSNYFHIWSEMSEKNLTEYYLLKDKSLSEISYGDC